MVIVKFRKVFCCRKATRWNKQFNNWSVQLTSCYQPECKVAQHLNSRYFAECNCSSGNTITSSRSSEIHRPKRLKSSFVCESPLTQFPWDFMVALCLLRNFSYNLHHLTSVHIPPSTNSYEVSCATTFPSYSVTSTKVSL